MARLLTLYLHILSSDASPLTSKELLIGRIKHNFALETQSCRQRELRAPTESQNEEGELQSQVRRLKRRCAKLERRLQEKEAEIHALQDQQQLRFPLLMHETMRNLRSLEDNQSDRSSSAMVGIVYLGCTAAFNGPLIIILNDCGRSHSRSQW
jgi:C4-dicarboxylate-specific signal transduction histidine kinase